eukprot:gnl/TRDRNA2_/TRDRNA2_39062_c0_seq1.p2 gnl/TRDRNA2_/TRDRNA2_39062_c0~~gnl/TRDRNA2_/TRDRNA2_39062_c0_seq1.p2  ORF type:complete len:193 (+),score=18.78 gnl/TRDRNA2_/TRDRNA2_39062_c0_seq1:86-664(+)
MAGYELHELPVGLPLRNLRVRNTFLEVADSCDPEEQPPRLQHSKSDSTLLSSHTSRSSSEYDGGSSRSASSERHSDSEQPSRSKQPSPPLVDGLPSIGSQKHADGTCQPCCFFRRAKCVKGTECQYCHSPHEVHQRPGKKTRERAARRKANASESSTSSQDSAGSRPPPKDGRTSQQTRQPPPPPRSYKTSL